MVGRLMRLGLVALCLVSAVPIWQVPSRAHAEPRVEASLQLSVG